TRGYYDTENNYVLSGLVSEERQRQLIEVMLQELSSTDWRSHLPNSWSLAGLKMLPMEPMLSRLRIVMPGYAEFDGLTLQRGFHDIQGRLVLRFTLIGLQNRQAEADLKKLLDAHPEWRARSAAGVRLQLSAKPEERDPRVVEETLLKAVTNLR